MNVHEEEEIRVALFEAQLRLGCVERFYPGLVAKSYKAFCLMIVEQHKEANNND